MQRKASHLEASCGNLTEEVQRTRLDVLAERKVVLSLRSEVRIASSSGYISSEPDLKHPKQASYKLWSTLAALSERAVWLQGMLERRSVPHPSTQALRFPFHCIPCKVLQVPKGLLFEICGSCGHWDVLLTGPACAGV